MKIHLILPLLIAPFLFGAHNASAQGVLKVGTVDMKKVFESYYKTKDAETRINEARNSAKKELDDRMDVYNKGVAEVKKLNEEIDKPELSKENKEQRSKSRDEKVAELKTMEREINEFRQTREKQLQEQSVRMRGGIVDDINKVVSDKVKAENFQIVFDKSGPSLNGVPVVLFAKDEYDFTPDVISALNKNKPKEELAPKADATAPKETKAGKVDLVPAKEKSEPAPGKKR
jgi:outer membrane protein